MTKLTDYDIKLINYIKRNKNKYNLFVCDVEHVSNTGMTRFIKVSMIYKGELVRLNHLIRTVLNQKIHNKYEGIKMTGCGMDMIFALLDNFVSNITNDRGYKFKSVQHYKTF